MARPVIKPLKMADGAYVRTSIEELKEHFDLPSVLGYYADGRLKEWLECRYYEDEAERLSQLNPDDDDFNLRLCELFGIECPEGLSANMNDIVAKNAKLVQLKQFTDSDEVIQNVDNVAFTQEEMTNLLDNNASHIYLCGKSFTVPLTKDNVTYVGVNSPEVSIADTEAVDLQGKNINFEGVVFSGSHRKLMVESFAKTVEKDSEKSELMLELATDKAQFSLDILCEKDNWIYFAPHDGFCRISSDGKEVEILQPFSSRKHHCRYIQFDNNCVYSGDYNGNIRGHSLINDNVSNEVSIDANISIHHDFTVHNENIYWHLGSEIIRSKLKYDNGQVHLKKNKLCIAKIDHRSPHYIYRNCIYYYRDDAIYMQKLDNRHEIMLCKTGKMIFYVDSGWVYFWDRNNCLNKIRADGSDKYKTNITCLDLFGSDKSHYNQKISTARVCGNYIYHFLPYGNTDFNLYNKFADSVEYLYKTPIGKSGRKITNKITLTKGISDKYSIIGNHLYDILTDGNRFSVVKYTLDGKRLWKCYIENN